MNTADCFFLLRDWLCLCHFLFCNCWLSLVSCFVTGVWHIFVCPLFGWQITTTARPNPRRRLAVCCWFLAPSQQPTNADVTNLSVTWRKPGSNHLKTRRRRLPSSMATESQQHQVRHTLRHIFILTQSVRVCVWSLSAQQKGCDLHVT